MGAVHKAKIWNAYLPIGGSVKTLEPPGAAAAWCMARGIDGDAPAVLRVVRHDVLPLIRTLERKTDLLGFSLLVHDRTSGVPCPAEDTTVYVHLRLQFLTTQCLQRTLKRLVLLPKPRSRAEAKMFAAASETAQRLCYLTPVVKESVEDKVVHIALDAQAAWYLRFIQHRVTLTDAELLGAIRQHLHYFANMAQMRVA